jgi:hypothetical protein
LIQYPKFLQGHLAWHSLQLQGWRDNLVFKLGCQGLRWLPHLVDCVRLLLRDIDVALTKRLEVDLMIVGPEDGKCTSYPEVKRLLHLGLIPLDTDPETTP